MCRHLAYLGPPVTVHALVFGPPFGLARQAWAPRRQRHGTMNVDGFGIGWYADGDPVPARYRRAGPIWADPCFADLARVTRTRALLAAVRSATDGNRRRRGRRRALRQRPLAVQPQRQAGRMARRDQRASPRACPPRSCSRWKRGATPRWRGRWWRPG